MIRVNLLGKVAYLKTEEEIFEFSKNQVKESKEKSILRDLMVSKEKLESDFRSLRAFPTKKLVIRKVILKNNLGVRVANYFMTFRFYLKASGKKSIMENILQPERLKKVVRGIFRLEKKTKRISLRDFFTIGSFSADGQKLGNFMPMVAKTVYEHWCPQENARILDFSAGFGGRLVGAMSSKYNYEYVGVDPSTKAIEGLNKVIGFLKAENRAKVICLPFEESEKELKGEFDFCFSSPPYFKKEIYSDEETQSCHRYPEIENWRKEFLEKSCEIIFRKLKNGKYFLINIAKVKIKGKEFDLEKIAVDTAKKVGFKHKGHYLMEMSRISGLKKRYKTEKIFVFKKLL